jgi:DMSO/TMAO reductase YedYZ molybdopterin-dependent catalytic subunit
LVLREAIRPPKFADKFHTLDFDASPMPAISLYPPPESLNLEDVTLDICGLDCKPRTVSWAQFADLSVIKTASPLICQIFNWSEVVEWSGFRVGDFLSHVGVHVDDDDYVSFHSRDGSYFESLPGVMALDPRVLLVNEMNGARLPEAFGGPLRLVVPFLQGYKSVKWLGAIRVLKHDPIGIKRLLGQSKTGHLGRAWRQTYGIDQEEGAEKTPV